MEKEYLNKLKKSWRTVVLITILMVILGLVLSFVQPLKYRASVEVLVIQKQEQAIDPYIAIRSAERLSKNLAQVIYTTSFFDKVMNSGFNIEDNFPKSENKKREAWKRMIDTYVAPETGMLKINVYHKDKIQAAQIAGAIAYVLATKGDEYHGGGKSVAIKTVDAVLTSRYPVRPNILVNLLASLILGILAGSGFVILRFKERLELGEQAREIGSINHNEDKTLVIKTKKVILEAPKEFSFEGLMKETDKVETIESEEKKDKLIPEQNFGLAKGKFVRKSKPFHLTKDKPSDGIWTMYDHLESINSKENKYFNDSKGLELEPGIV